MVHDLWYKNAIIYCLNVSTFMDSDEDGIGDFRGLIQRLDYLQGLGVTAIWLMPFQPSPREDHGYDISDYYSVDPRFGTLGDFVEFTHAAKQRGIRVVIDLVVNHTSDQHPWFQDARRSSASRFRDWYIWSDTEPPDASQGVIFPGVQESTWTHDDKACAWYFHRFYEFQPDLNIANPRVQAEILKIMGFWIQLGVHGFRLDAVPFVIGAEGPEVARPDEPFSMLRTFREFLQWRQGDSVFLAEANIPPERSVDYFGEDGDRLQMLFNFPVNQSLFLALATQDARPLAEAIEATRHKPRTAQWAQFLRNHDELDLGRLTEVERNKVFAAFAPEASMQIYGRGIRRRLAPMLDGNRSRLELAHSLLFALPGAPVIRYGDEIGMGEDLSLSERDPVRTPMQWSAGPQGGFTRGDAPIKPVISHGPFAYDHVNVASQRRDPNSFMNWLERVIRMRKEVPEIGLGEVSVIDVGDPAVLALRYDWLNDVVIILHNFAQDPREVTVKARSGEEAVLVNLLAEEDSQADARGRHRVALPSYGHRWYRAAGLGDFPGHMEARGR